MNRTTERAKAVVGHHKKIRVGRKFGPNLANQGIGFFIDPKNRLPNFGVLGPAPIGVSLVQITPKHMLDQIGDTKVTEKKSFIETRQFEVQGLFVFIEDRISLLQ